MSLNLAGILDSSARRFPREPAIYHGERPVTHGELGDQARRVAGLLKARGVRRGDRVALMMANRPEFTAVYFGILYAGAVVVPLNRLFVGEEVAYHLEDSGAALLVAGEEVEPAARAGAARAPLCRELLIAAARPDDCPFRAELASAPRVDAPEQTRPDDTAVILYTSGTTGRPKGAELTHFNLYSNARWSSERSQSVPPDRMVAFGPGCAALCALPLFHSFGQTCVQNTMLFHGGAFVCMPQWDPEEALSLMERLRVTHFCGVPTMYFGLLHAANAGGCGLEALRFCNSGGAPMPLEVMTAFEQRYGVTVMEGYGLSETSPVATFHTPEFPRRPGAVGKAIDGCEVAIVDDSDRLLPAGELGEVVIRGHNIMKGYLGRPEATREALRGGWFHSGDLGRMDEEGYLYIVDRKKDMILRGGFNVYPRELEEVIYAHPAVQEAAVVGVPHPEHGEEVAAVLVLRAGAALSAPEFIDYCRRRMAAYKYPRIVEFRPTLPRGGTGKILKRQLREELAARPAPGRGPGGGA